MVTCFARARRASAGAPKARGRRWCRASGAAGAALDEDLGRQSFGNYARGWLRDHPKMGPRYRETCTRNLRLHLQPLDDVPLQAVTPTVVREWYAAAMRGSGGRASIMQSYRLLRAVLNTAVRDGAIVKNPCQITGAGSDRAKERPVASPDEVVALMEAITPRYRAAVLLAAWCGLRRGEVLGLRRPDIDLRAGTVTVRHNRVELLESPVAFDTDPKTDAGMRTVVIPPHVLPVLAEHMATWAGEDRVFIGRDGAPMRGMPFGWHSIVPGAGRGCRAFGSMTCGIRARLSLRQLARLPRI